MRHGEKNTCHIMLVIYIKIQAIPDLFFDIRIDKPFHKKIEPFVITGGQT
jgi:hypothetical protein